ncbi:MAG: hypothetical protein IT186_09635 [Acidobacteria bacterium]|nr:hypothetical protein [Acidobacteriota bacterium]
MQPYIDLRESIQTGDIILFSGKGGISTGIKWMTNSRWSHVGMALRITGWDLVMLWESTTLSNIRDVETGEEKQGVQLVPLSERLKRYDGAVRVRHLIVDRDNSMLSKLEAFRHDMKGRPYEKSKIELLKAAYDGPLGLNQEDLSSLFCSELVAEAYQRMGLLPNSPHSNEYTPKDFSQEKELLLLKGRLGPEISLRA